MPAVQEDSDSRLTTFSRCACRRRALQGRINEAIEVHDVTNKEEAKAARRATLEDGAPLVPFQRAKSITGNQGEGSRWQAGRVGYAWAQKCCRQPGGGCSVHQEDW